jgi:hypothetical protein
VEVTVSITDIHILNYSGSLEEGGSGTSSGSAGLNEERATVPHLARFTGGCSRERQTPMVSIRWLVQEDWSKLTRLLFKNVEA